MTGGETGTITISIGGGAEAGRAGWAWPPTEANGLLARLRHRVVLTGPGETQSFAIEYNGVPVTRAVNEGRWTVTVSAYMDDLDGELYATGSRGVDVIAGQDNGVTVNMTPAFDIPACEHEWGQWEISIVLNITTGLGVETGTCAKCGAERTRHFTTIANAPPGLVIQMSDNAMFGPVGTYAVRKSPDAEGDVVIPGWVHEPNGTVVRISSLHETFETNAKITSATIHEGVTIIGENAFYGSSSLISVEIPDGVTTIGNYAFFGCSSLISVKIPDGVTTIGEDAFRDCSRLASAEIPDSVTTIRSGAFQGCTLLVTTIPNGLTEIGESVFMGCTSLASVTIPDSVTIIHLAAFRNSGLTSVTFKWADTEITDPDSFPSGQSLIDAYEIGKAGTYELNGGTWEKKQ